MFIESHNVRNRWRKIATVSLMGLSMTLLTLAVLWSTVQAGTFSSGAGGCGDFATAVLAAADGDTVIQMTGVKASGGVVISKNLRISGGWAPNPTCDVNTQEFATPADIVSFGLIYGAPISRSELNHSSAPVLTIEDEGAATFPNVSQLVIEEMIFNSNDPLTDGGGIQGVLSGTAAALFDNNIFRFSNDVTNNGGGIHLELRGNSRLTIEDSQFLTNTVGNNGSGLYIDLQNDAILTIDRTLFSNNEALNGSGFEIYVRDNSQLIIKNSIFQNNFTTNATGLGAGGRIFVEGGQVSIDNSLFDNNSAGSQGGGLYIEMNGGQVTVANTLFTNNDAGDSGGALYVESIGNSPATITLMNVSFSNNLPDNTQFVQSGSGALTTQILDNGIYLPAIARDFDASAQYARITNITRDSNYVYAVEFETINFTPSLSDVHVHFFFDTVDPAYAGTALCPFPSDPNQCKWIAYDGGSPFTGYSFGHAHNLFGPAGPEKICILVADGDHSVRPNTGNCVELP